MCDVSRKRATFRRCRTSTTDVRNAASSLPSFLVYTPIAQLNYLQYVQVSQCLAPEKAKFYFSARVFADLAKEHGDSVPWRLTLKEQGGKLVGTIGGEQGDAPLSNLKVEGSKIHFTTPYDGEDYDQDLEMEGTKLVGTWSGNGNSGKTTGERTAGS